MCRHHIHRPSSVVRRPSTVDRRPSSVVVVVVVRRGRRRPSVGVRPSCITNHILIHGGLHMVIFGLMNSSSIPRKLFL